MVAGSNTFRSIVFVMVALAVSLTVAGFAASAYRNERTDLGSRHFQSGEFSLEHADLSGAIDQFRKALLFSPDDEQYRLALAESLVGANHLDEAQSHLEQLVEEDPGNGQINSLLAQIAEKQGKINQAIERYQRAVYAYWSPDMIPKRRSARRSLIRLLELKKRNIEAIAELIQLNSSATNPAERIDIAFNLLHYGALSEAGRIFRNIEAAEPVQSAPRRGIGIIDFDSGEFVAARHEFQAAHHLDPKDQESVRWLDITNQIIDLDPLLPGISSTERLRRSKNLLNSVIHALTTCQPGVPSNAESASELTAAEQLLTSKQKIDGVADVMQQSAAQLWRDGRLFCNGNLAIEDKPIDIAIARVAGE